MSCALDATSANETREAVLYFTSYSTTDKNLCQEHCVNAFAKYAVLNSDIGLCLCGNTHSDFSCPCRFQPEPENGYYNASLCNKFYLRGSFTVLANLTFDYVPPLYMGINYTYQAHTIAAVVGQYMWNFGDNTENYYSVGPSIAYSYVLPGTYVLNLQVNTISQNLSGSIPVKVLNLVTGYKLKCSKHIDYSKQMTATLSISQGTEVELPWKRVDKYGEEWKGIN